ncbi:hypothetical protein BDA96_05G164700 [Sorghum bicolor]|uniref:[RNA-polymerase]-subunit kinase n=2 Tax=Sorghum bicolor TaxID=4558 RepID=A0A921R086_SORBI|nr:putative cyclin-dependent kinase F-2 [Sorghum bicolor]KAG0530197.1 hypothetical protein BDA96_05G164700 [Sorghum bicolor]|eukprot:XP_002450945.1 putative cyclin-dependent kinase F-2 [Sorghum bicolor]
MAVVVAPTRRPRGAAQNRRGAKKNGGDKAARVSVVDSSYKILKKIGQGGHGAVSMARHVESGELVAIKSSLHAGAAALLLREAAMLAACAGNPAVVRLREVARGRGTDMRDLHLVMEYVAGGSLHDVIVSRRRHGHLSPFSESETRSAMAQLLAGVSTMHAHGVVHRDLKPGNVLVGEGDGRLKICDLGLARSVVAPPPTDDTRDPEGTPGYMAPELLLGEKDCGAPVDVWALGCIMAVLVAGQPLFPEEDLCQQLISIVNLLGIPDDVSLMPLGVSGPSKLRERVPEELLSPAGFDVLQGLLEYNPKDRLTAGDALKMPWFAGAKDD